jgi:hypothetical protein
MNRKDRECHARLERERTARRLMNIFGYRERQARKAAKAAALQHEEECDSLHGRGAYTCDRNEERPGRTMRVIRPERRQAAF